MTLSELIERVEKLDGPSTTADKDILAYLGFTWRGMDFWHSDNKRTWGQSSFMTETLDGAAALATRMLPGWAYGVDIGPKTNIAFVDPNDYADRFLGARYTSEAKTPAIALVLATLKAISAQERDDGR